MGTPRKSSPAEEKKGIDKGDSGDFAMKQTQKENSLDENSDYLTSMLSKVALNEQQKLDVKQLLKDELKTSVSEMKSELTKETQEIKKDFLTIFGLFASFVTFLSIEVQVFKNKDNVLELIGITSISLSFIMFFALVINDISKDKNEWSDFKKPSYILNLFFAVIGIITLYIGATCSISKMDKIHNQTKQDSIRIIKLEKEVKDFKNSFEKSKSLPVSVSAEVQLNHQNVKNNTHKSQ